MADIAIKASAMNRANVKFQAVAPNKFKLVVEDTHKIVIDDGEVYVVRCGYPKTYEECCESLFNSIALGKIVTSGYNCELLKRFGKLLICRDAYWKIAGNWKPVWSSKDGIKYGICVDCNRTMRCTRLTGNVILIFPTEEMRDAFYENFKDLIEECKELL